MQPLFEPLAYESSEYYAAKLQHLNGFVWLDSARFHHEMGRYSYIGLEPFAEIIADADTVTFQGRRYRCEHALRELNHILNQYTLTPIPELPPFQGGALGYFSYELNQQLEPDKLNNGHQHTGPLMALGLYDVVIAFDHQRQNAWIIASGLPETNKTTRFKRAHQRMAQLRHQLAQPSPGPCDSQPIPAEAIGSNFSPEGYRQAVQIGRNYIRQGDIFEVNLAQRFECQLAQAVHPFSLYRQLRVNNPAPFAAHVQLGGQTILSASPERFIQSKSGDVETRPIKGTAPRGPTPALDQAYAEALQQSDKDWAENIMIVDLLRNDLSKVCQPGSVHVPQLCGLESFETVHHLVSVVTGRLKPGYHAVDLLAASFPGGSITGAPKVRSMAIINELENVPRGPYCGSVGYIGFDGTMDTSIAIRTMVLEDQWLTFHAGGAVVLDSDPETEYQETLTKAQALIDTLTELPHGAYH